MDEFLYGLDIIFKIDVFQHLRFHFEVAVCPRLLRVKLSTQICWKVVFLFDDIRVILCIRCTASGLSLDASEPVSNRYQGGVILTARVRPLA